MKINKKFYHGTSIENFAKILNDKMLRSMNGSCATDDYHYAKSYAKFHGLGVVIMFKIECDMRIKHWITYWINRNIIRTLIGWNKSLSEWYDENFDEYSWGFCENTLEIYIDNIPLKNIKKIWLVGSHLNIAGVK